MGKIVKLNAKKTKISNKIIDNVKVQIIYIPLEDKKGNMYKSLVKEGDYVYKEQVIAINEEQNLLIHSSVSGNVVANTFKIISTNKEVECITIENDFKEKTNKSKIFKDNIANYTKEEFINLLKESGIIGLSGSNYPTYLKYQNISDIKCLLINGVECEPYLNCDKSLMINYYEEILEAIDAIMEIMKIPRAIIVLKKSQIKIANLFNKYIGSYPRIKIFGVLDGYPSGWEKSVINQVLHIDYEKYPSEIGVITNNVSTIYAIYQLLKYNHPFTDRIITINGNGIIKPINIKVKLGTSFKDIVKHFDGYKKKGPFILIVGGPMMGNSLKTDDFVITKDITSITILKEEKNKVTPCFRCGKCSNVCPVNLMPVMIMKNISDKKTLKKLHPDKCIECGLCSYICPCKLELREFVRRAKGAIADE